VSARRNRATVAWGSTKHRPSRPRPQNRPDHRVYPIWQRGVAAARDVLCYCVLPELALDHDHVRRARRLDGIDINVHVPWRELDGLLSLDFLEPAFLEYLCRSGFEFSPVARKLARSRGSRQTHSRSIAASPMSLQGPGGGRTPSASSSPAPPANLRSVSSRR
jgi:hypothetical protein